MMALRRAVDGELIQICNECREDFDFGVPVLYVQKGLNWKGYCSSCAEIVKAKEWKEAQE